MKLLLIIFICTITHAHAQSIVSVDTLRIKGSLPVYKISNTYTPTTITPNGLYTAFITDWMFSNHPTILKLKSDVAKALTGNATLKVQLDAAIAINTKQQAQITKLLGDTIYLKLGTGQTISGSGTKTSPYVIK